jgi:hypothetical protein
MPQTFGAATRVMTLARAALQDGLVEVHRASAAGGRARLPCAMKPIATATDQW